MLLLIRKNPFRSWTAAVLIYIPLCFYLYGGNPSSSRSRLIDLHSTMLLLILCGRAWKMLPQRYLHSTMLLLIPCSCPSISQMPSNLHSTMLLLILIPCLPSSVFFPYLHSTMLLLIPSLFVRIPSPFSDLHSTMLLLIQYRIHPEIRCAGIYIPLCFYLYGAREALMQTLITFTFHYASTYTSENIRVCELYDWFTFHYASTYTKAVIH